MLSPNNPMAVSASPATKSQRISTFHVASNAWTVTVAGFWTISATAITMAAAKSTNPTTIMASSCSGNRGPKGLWPGRTHDRRKVCASPGQITPAGPKSEAAAAGRCRANASAATARGPAALGGYVFWSALPGGPARVLLVDHEQPPATAHDDRSVLGGQRSQRIPLLHEDSSRVDRIGESTISALRGTRRAGAR